VPIKLLVANVTDCPGVFGSRVFGFDVRVQAGLGELFVACHANVRGFGLFLFVVNFGVGKASCSCCSFLFR